MRPATCHVGMKLKIDFLFTKFYLRFPLRLYVLVPFDTKSRTALSYFFPLVYTDINKTNEGSSTKAKAKRHASRICLTRVDWALVNVAFMCDLMRQPIFNDMTRFELTIFIQKGFLACFIARNDDTMMSCVNNLFTFYTGFSSDSRLLVLLCPSTTSSWVY